MKSIRKRLHGIDVRLHGRHICEHDDCLTCSIQCYLNDYDDEGDYRWDCRSSCRDEFKSGLGETPKPMKGRNSRKPRNVNIDGLSHFSPPFFMGGGLARPRQLLQDDHERYVHD